MNPTVLVPARRKDGNWNDLKMLLHSLYYYGGATPVIVAWSGPEMPTFKSHDHLRFIRQPDDCKTFGAACNFLLQSVPYNPDGYVFINDDVVLTPATLAQLKADVQEIKKAVGEQHIGFVASRTNACRMTPQNVRVTEQNGGVSGFGWASEENIIKIDVVSPICAWVSGEALQEIGYFPDLNWYSDDLMCWKMKQVGRSCFVSRSYVHHLGMVATTLEGHTAVGLTRDAFDWIAKHNPDFLGYLLEVDPNAR